MLRNGLLTGDSRALGCRDGRRPHSSPVVSDPAKEDGTRERGVPHASPAGSQIMITILT